MSVCVNGCPKSGTHALLKACELLGMFVGDVSHIPFGQPLPTGTTKHCFIIRDPRNVMISWMRMNGMTVTDGTFMALAQQPEGTQSLLQVAESYAGWINDPNTFCVKFEDLIASAAPMQNLATYLGVPYLDTAFPNLPGYTVTWTGDGATPAYSDYTTIWTPALQAYWAANGGPALLAAFGYV